MRPKYDELRTALLKKARLLPARPGVYLFYSKQGVLLYVGKSKALQNRVSSYFQSGEKNSKTARLVAQIDHFDTILTDTEEEALLLENELIKRNQPKYNILLKDDKSFPYLYLSRGDAYPRLSIRRGRREKDAGLYFGPYGSGAVAHELIRAANRLFLLPRCQKRFPAEIGRGRPCLYHDMGRCMGLCTGKISESDYARTVDALILFLKHDHKALKKTLEAQMQEKSAQMQFEQAAKLRDAVAALAALDTPQRILAAPTLCADVYALFAHEALLCVARLCVRHGALVDASYDCFGPAQIVEPEGFYTMLYDYYRHAQDLPQKLYFDKHLFFAEDTLLSALLSERAGHKVTLSCPQRGEGAHLVALAAENAKKEAEHRLATQAVEDKASGALGELLSLPAAPKRIESYDISNSGNDCIYGGMVVCENGRFCKRLYRSFRVEQEKKDDYAAMKEVLCRRLAHAKQGGDWQAPDLILVDGGHAHVAVARKAVAEAGFPELPVYGMVKDEHHKTRTLVDEKNEISIAKNGAVFGLIYRIQEETHRFALSGMDKSRRRKMTASRLSEIPGIGEQKAAALMKRFRSVAAIAAADESDLRQTPGIGKGDAARICDFFAQD